MYDKEFEELWNSRYAWPAVKKTYYEFWQAAKSLKPEKKKIELEGGRYIIAPKDGFVDAGLSRKTEADAIKARDMITRRNRLAAFVYEHCGFEGEFGEKCNYYMCIDVDGYYCFVKDDEFHDLCKQYMPEETAIWLCEKLNSGEIVL